MFPFPRKFLTTVASACCMAIAVAGCSPQHETQPEAKMAETNTIPIKVNTMTCVEGCFNGIQKVLKKRPGIEEVKLAPQANDEGQVDNSVILVTYTGELDRNEVERTILGAGFDSIEFMEAPQ